MAGDGQQTIGGTICSSNGVKVRKLADGSLFGACGTSQDAARLVEWIDAGRLGDPPQLVKGFGALWLHTDGAFLAADDSGRFVPLEAPFAIGSGSDHAVTAMDAGMSPGQAVALAALRDPHTGGTIITRTLAGRQTA